MRAEHEWLGDRTFDHQNERITSACRGVMEEFHEFLADLVREKRVVKMKAY
jgi:hypothetical protein